MPPDTAPLTVRFPPLLLLNQHKAGSVPARTQNVSSSNIPDVQQSILPVPGKLTCCRHPREVLATFLEQSRVRTLFTTISRCCSRCITKVLSGVEVGVLNIQHNQRGNDNQAMKHKPRRQRDKKESETNRNRLLTFSHALAAAALQFVGL